MLDQFYESILLGGIAVAFLGWFWLVVVAFRCSRGWGLAVLLLPPLSLPFIVQHWNLARPPAGVLTAGLLIAFTPAIYTRVAQDDIGPRYKIVDGEGHLTLTGWDQHDYSVIRQFPNVVVVQIANADVTNDTLQYLADCPKIRELDLSSSQVTDDGLAVIADLPELQSLWLKNCHITDAGFKDHLASHAALKQLDLRGTSVSREAIRDWRRADPSRKAMQLVNGPLPTDRAADAVPQSSLATPIEPSATDRPLADRPSAGEPMVDNPLVESPPDAAPMPANP